MLLFNLPPKLLFFFAMAMLLAGKSTQQMPNVTKTNAKIDYFKLANELVDAALENAELGNGWWKKHAFGILCDANFAKFESKMDENLGKLRNNFCEIMRNDFSNENLLKIFANDKKAFGNLMAFVSTDKPIIGPKTIHQKIKNYPILSNENQENLASMFGHLNAGAAIITQIMKSKSFTIAKLMGTNRRRKRYNQNNTNHNYEEIRRRAQLIRGRRRMAANAVALENCDIGLIHLIFVFWLLLDHPPLIFESGLLPSSYVWVFLSIYMLCLLCIVVVNCRYAYFNSDPILPL